MSGQLVALFLFVVACSSATAAGRDGSVPAGPERLSLSRGAFDLAPGRDAWLVVSTFVQTSPTRLTSVTPSVTFESSNPTIVTVTPDSAQYARVVAKSLGTATITVRSKRDPANIATARVTVSNAPAANDAGLTYVATAALVPSSSNAQNVRLGPSELAVNVTVSNPTNARRDVWLSGCSAWIRIYATAEYSGSPLVDIPRDVLCGADMRHLTLAPGQSESFPAEGFRLTLSGESLTPGRYYIAAAVDRVRDLLPVRAGPVDIVDPNAGLNFTATTEVSGGQIRPHMSFTNTNAAPVRLEFGGCSMSLHAFRSADRSGAPAWSSEARVDSNGFGYACLSYLVTTTIAPGQTASPKEFNPTFSVAEMLGDSLPAGRYYFTAQARLNWRRVAVIAGEAALAK